MRTKSFCQFVLIAVSCAVRLAAGQAPAGPALLPPPEPGWRQGVESYSVPWYPPETTGQPPLREEPLPIPDIEGSDGPAPNVVRVDPDLPWYRPTYWLGDDWDTTLEMGLNGSTGTSESMSLRAGGAMKRTSPYSRLTLSSYYNHTTRGGTATQSNANADARNDWLLDETSLWMLYGTANLFYDQFQAFDLQANANTGIGYRFLNDPAREFIGRFGGGVSRKFGGPDERWVPESLLGIEFTRRFSKAQKLYGKLDYFPEWDQIGEYRLVADAGWELALVEPRNVSLKVSASDRYESNPGSTSPHLVNYSVTLLMRL